MNFSPLFPKAVFPDHVCVFQTVFCFRLRPNGTFLECRCVRNLWCVRARSETHMLVGTRKNVNQQHFVFVKLEIHALIHVLLLISPYCLLPVEWEYIHACILSNLIHFYFMLHIHTQRQFNVSHTRQADKHTRKRSKYH